MHTGMLWFDDSQITLNMKIQNAMEYYRKKYGRVPDLCLVHPNMLKDTKLLCSPVIFGSGSRTKNKSASRIRVESYPLQNHPAASPSAAG
jgi:hypothetical protein